MSIFAKSYILGLMLCSCASMAQKQEFKETITKEFPLTNTASKYTLDLHNLNGFIKVEGYEGDKIIIVVEKAISAKNSKTLEEGKDELKITFESLKDTLLIFLQDPFNTDPRRKHNRGNNNNEHIDYDFNTDFTIRVPNQLNVSVSTINQGDVIVNNVTGVLKTNNINGSITITNAKSITEAHTINGEIEANYITNPEGISNFYTLNGDIKVVYPADFSSDINFKTSNGDFFTDFDTKMLPAIVTKIKKNNGGSTVYKLNKDSSVRIGKGGNVSSFETFNGNIYIKKQK